MPASNTLDRVVVTFDDTHAVADAGLVLAAVLAQHLGLRALFDIHVDPGAAAGHANVGHKAMMLIHSALADGDSIDDANALRSGGHCRGAGACGAGPFHAGHVPAQFHPGHARQLDVVSGAVLGRARAAAAPGASWPEPKG
jgi:hypothetical protein